MEFIIEVRFNNVQLKQMKLLSSLLSGNKMIKTVSISKSTFGGILEYLTKCRRQKIKKGFEKGNQKMGCHGYPLVFFFVSGHRSLY